MKWRTVTIVVDLETGEIVNWKEVEEYYTVKTVKEIKIYGPSKGGLIRWIRLSRKRNKQGTLFETGSE